jgi:hypothetical protein
LAAKINFYLGIVNEEHRNLSIAEHYYRRAKELAIQSGDTENVVITSLEIMLERGQKQKV